VWGAIPFPGSRYATLVSEETTSTSLVHVGRAVAEDRYIVASTFVGRHSRDHQRRVRILHEPDSPATQSPPSELPSRLQRAITPTASTNQHLAKFGLVDLELIGVTRIVKK